jgi:hypothetical protein
MTLLQKQKEFARLVAVLINKAIALNYEVSLGETYRPPETARAYAQKGIGSEHSLHTKRLAIDINLFKGGVWLTKSEDHKALGDFWESLSCGEIQCCWGGRWGDGNHYSITHNGVR